MRGRGVWVAIVVVLSVCGGPRLARATAAAQAPRTAATAGEREREARRIETMLVAPCCWREQVSVHQSDAAERVKQEIREMLGAGLTRQQVLDRFASAYGARILVEPPDAGVGRLLHHLPWMVGVVSLAGLAVVVRRLTRRRLAPNGTSPAAPKEAATPADGLDRRYEQQLDDELRDLD